MPRLEPHTGMKTPWGRADNIRKFIECIQISTSKSIDYLRSTPIDAQRKSVEKTQGKPLTFKNYFPAIGCGNVLHDRISTHEEIEAALDMTLGNR